MELQDAINLIDNIRIRHQTSAVWADLGCGSGLFSYALANLLTSGSIILAIDKTATKLSRDKNPNNVLIQRLQLNFITDELPRSDLDGILMANSLHFAKDKIMLLSKLSRCLKDTGGFLIIEYDTDFPNPWVPFPVGYPSLKKLCEKVGYSRVTKIGERASAFRRAPIYAALVDV